MDHSLPSEFADLAHFGPDWFADSEKERHSRRLRGTPDELKGLYEAVLPRLDEMVGYLDQFPLDDLTQEQKNLLNLALSFMEVSMAVESFDGAAKVPFGFDTSRWEVHF